MSAAHAAAFTIVCVFLLVILLGGVIHRKLVTDRGWANWDAEQARKESVRMRALTPKPAYNPIDIKV